MANKNYYSRKNTQNNISEKIKVCYDYHWKHPNVNFDPKMVILSMTVTFCIISKQLSTMKVNMPNQQKLQKSQTDQTSSHNKILL